MVSMYYLHSAKELVIGQFVQYTTLEQCLYFCDGTVYCSDWHITRSCGEEIFPRKKCLRALTVIISTGCVVSNGSVTCYCYHWRHISDKWTLTSHHLLFKHFSNLEIPFLNPKQALIIHHNLCSQLYLDIFNILNVQT